MTGCLEHQHSLGCSVASTSMSGCFFLLPSYLLGLPTVTAQLLRHNDMHGGCRAVEGDIEKIRSTAHAQDQCLPHVRVTLVQGDYVQL